MKKQLMIATCVLTSTLFTGCGGRNIRMAQDITPGNPRGEVMDWRYGATDIKIQTTKITSTLMDRWYTRLGGCCEDHNILPVMVISEIDNRTDMYISTDMIHEIFEGVAINDGRFIVTVGNGCDEYELDRKMGKIQSMSKYNNSTKLHSGQATAPQFLAKVRITKAVTSDPRYDYEDYRMSVTLYDIETQEAVDSSWDVLRKRVQA